MIGVKRQRLHVGGVVLFLYHLLAILQASLFILRVGGSVVSFLRSRVLSRKMVDGFDNFARHGRREASWSLVTLVDSVFALGGTLGGEMIHQRRAKETIHFPVPWVFIPISPGTNGTYEERASRRRHLGIAGLSPENDLIDACGGPWRHVDDGVRSK